MNELIVTKEKVLQAARECPQAKETLKTLFPEVFEDDIKQRLKVYPQGVWLCFTDSPRLLDFNGIPRISVQADNGCFFLSEEFNWQIFHGNYLYPTKK